MQSSAEHAKTAASFCMFLLKQKQSSAEHAKTVKAELCMVLLKQNQAKTAS
jgi:hypothetical protein